MPKTLRTNEEFQAAERRCGDNARAVLAAIRDLDSQVTCREVTKRVFERGEWSSEGHPTKRETPAQRGEPYEGIVYQHLRNFVQRGLVTEGPPAAAHAKRPKLYVAVAVPGSPSHAQQPLEGAGGPRVMRKRAQEAIDLRAAGTPQERSFKEVAEAMGVSYGYANELCNDPYGERMAERKRAKECLTPGCTRRTSDGRRRCHGCRTAIDDLMPSCRIERWTRAIAREQRITVNFLLVETNDASLFARVVEVETPRGKVERKLRKGDTWKDALGACGIDVDLVR